MDEKRQASESEADSGSRARIVRSEPATAASLGGFRWVRLRKLTYVDDAGVERAWEMAERSTRKGDVDGVAIVAVLTSARARTKALLLVSQYRPPADAHVLELPAGLVDAGETASQAALRELREETGYEGTVVKESPIVMADPGMSSANMRFVTVSVDLDDAANAGGPTPQLEEGEHIESHVVPLADVAKVLDDPRLLVRKPNVSVDARLYGMGAALVQSLL